MDNSGGFEGGGIQEAEMAPPAGGHHAHHHPTSSNVLCHPCEQAGEGRQAGHHRSDGANLWPLWSSGGDPEDFSQNRQK